MIKVTIKQFLDGEHQERLEDALAKCLNDFSVEAEIENTETGNSMSIHNTYQLSNQARPKFQIENSQSGAPDGEPFEAESLEEAQRMILEWNGITIREVKKEEKM